VVSIQQGSFVPRRGDVVLASAHKCGTTWLKALAFATMARGAYPPAGAGHPLLRLNPHDCVPFMDILFADAGSGSAKMAALPSPRLMATHMHHSILPDSISKNPDCKIVYICRYLLQLTNKNARNSHDLPVLAITISGQLFRIRQGP
jgi:hypothetical protein